jgi:BASS family bile acid:Na+ symporter
MREALAGVLNIAVLIFAVSSMLSVGLAHDWRDIVAPLRQLYKVFRALATNFVLVPLLAWLVLQAIPLEQPIAVGLFLVATAAGAAFLIKLAQLADSDIALSTTLLLVLLPATIVYMPIVVPLVLPDARVNATAIAAPLVFTMLLPLILGLAAHEYLAGMAARLQPFMRKLSTLALVVLIGATVLLNLRDVLLILRSTAILAALVFVTGAFAIGYLSGGPSRESKEILGLGTSQRNIAAAMVVASEAVGDADTLSMVVVTSLVTFVVLFPIAGAIRRHRRRDALA